MSNQHALKDICIRITKGTTPTTMGRPFVDEGINFVKAESLNGDTSLERSGFAFIDEDTHQMLRRSILEKDDVLVTIAGANTGKCGFVTERDLPANTNQAVGIVRINKEKAEPRFVYYFFKQKSTLEYIQTLSAQAAQPNLNLANLGNVRIELPSNDEQYRIASILSAYDNLIENNRRRMALLERAARLLYREWFVRLRFPGHENVRIEDGVPEGWERKTVGDVSCFISRGITPKYDDEAPGIVINQKCIRDRKVTLEQARHQSREVPSNKIVRYGDVLINSTGQGTLGRVAQFLDSIEGCTVDSHVTIARPAKAVPIFLYGQQISSMEDYLAVMGRGATNQTELSRETIASLPILCPPNEIACHFEMFKEETARLTQNLIQQNIKLAKSRDLLLPRLMKEEIAI